MARSLPANARQDGALQDPHHPHRQWLTVRPDQSGGQARIEHIFGRLRQQNGIEHRLTKPYHPWTNCQAERMVRTILFAPAQVKDVNALDTDNFPRLVAEVEKQKSVKQGALKEARILLNANAPAAARIKKIRNKVVAHQDDTSTQPRRYAAAKLTLPMPVSLRDASLEIANCLCTACGLLKPYPQFLTSGPYQHRSPVPSYDSPLATTAL